MDKALFLQLVKIGLDTAETIAKLSDNEMVIKGVALVRQVFSTLFPDYAATGPPPEFTPEETAILEKAQAEVKACCPDVCD